MKSKLLLFLLMLAGLIQGGHGTGLDWWPFHPAPRQPATLTIAPRYEASNDSMTTHITYTAHKKIRVVEVLVNNTSRAVQQVSASVKGEADVTIAASVLSADERNKPLKLQARIYEQYSAGHQNKPAAISAVHELTLPSLRQISWTPDSLALSGLSGSGKIVAMDVKSDKKVDKATFSVSNELKKIVQPQLESEAVIEANSLYNVPLQVSIPIQTPAGEYKGTIELREAGTIISTASITVTVTQSNATTIPTTIADPSADAIAETPSGLKYVKNEVFVGLDLQLGSPDVRIKEVAAQTGGSIIGSVPLARAYQLRYDGLSADQLEAKRDEIAALSGVSFASRNMAADAAATPNDKGYKLTDTSPDPWIVDNKNPRTWGQRFIKLPKAWDTTTGNKATRIGVIDTQFEPSHEDLKNSISKTSPKLSNYWFGTGSHGTLVAGTICAEGNNAIGIAGVNWRCSLGLYDAQGGFFGISMPRTLDMMTKAAADDMRVVNISFGWGVRDDFCGHGISKTEVEEANRHVRQGINSAKEMNKDVLWVFAGGNSCRDVKEVAPGSLVPEFPKNTMAVTAVQQIEDIRPTAKAERLKEAGWGDGITVAAPGQNIYTTSINKESSFEGVCSTQPDKPCVSHYKDASGSSLAAPFVTGLAGLVLSTHSDYTAEDVKQCIVKAAHEYGQDVEGHAFKVISAPETVKCKKPVPPPTRQCVFEMSNRPTECESTNPTVKVNFVNESSNGPCDYESHLTWVNRDSSTKQVDTITGLAFGGVKPLGSRTFTTLGKHSIDHSFKTVSGRCILLNRMYTFTLRSAN